MLKCWLTMKCSCLLSNMIVWYECSLNRVQSVILYGAGQWNQALFPSGLIRLYETCNVCPASNETAADTCFQDRVSAGVSRRRRPTRTQRSFISKAWELTVSLSSSCQTPLAFSNSRLFIRHTFLRGVWHWIVAFGDATEDLLSVQM